MAAAVQLPRLFLARHGDTEWTDSHRHTGRTDIPLNARGEEHARELGEWLQKFSFARVFTSPLERAHRTCELAGYLASAEVDEDLVEWNYGRHEGKLTKEILRELPGWDLFRDGCEGGESPGDVARRADAVIARVRRLQGNVLAFSHGHMIHMLAARWCRLQPAAGRSFYCRPASIGILGLEHESLEEPIVELWNYVGEL